MNLIVIFFTASVWYDLDIYLVLHLVSAFVPNLWREQLRRCSPPQHQGSNVQYWMCSSYCSNSSVEAVWQSQSVHEHRPTAASEQLCSRYLSLHTVESWKKGKLVMERIDEWRQKRIVGYVGQKALYFLIRNLIYKLESNVRKSVFSFFCASAAKPKAH